MEDGGNRPLDLQSLLSSLQIFKRGRKKINDVREEEEIEDSIIYL